MPTSTEFIKFHLFKMPCCGQMLCWVNPRFPNYCPECGTRVFPEIKNPEHWLGYDENGKLVLNMKVSM